MKRHPGLGFGVDRDMHRYILLLLFLSQIHKIRTVGIMTENEGVRSGLGSSCQCWAGSQRLGSMGTHRPPSVLLKVSLQRGVRGSQQVLITKVRRPPKWNKLFTVFKGDGLIPGGLIFSFLQAEFDRIEGLILQVERRKKL